MKKVFALVLTVIFAASCTQIERGASWGATSGAILGGLVGGNVQSAALGAAFGGAAGAFVGHVMDQPGKCYYRDQYGRRYTDSCRNR